MDVTNMWSQSTTGPFQRGKIWPFTTYTYNAPDGSITTDPLFGKSVLLLCYYLSNYLLKI